MEQEQEQKPLSLAEILSKMTSLERLMDDPNSIDPETLIGDMGANRDALAEKVDAIDYVIREFEAYAERTEARAKKIASRAKTAAASAARLKTYLLFQMQSHGFEKLPGVERCVELVRSSNPSVKTTRQPTAVDALELGDMVRVIPTAYEWNKASVKDAIKEEPTRFDWASLEYSYRIVFDDRDRPDVSTKTKKGKAKK